MYIKRIGMYVLNVAQNYSYVASPKNSNAYHDPTIFDKLLKILGMHKTFVNFPSPKNQQNRTVGFQQIIYRVQLTRIVVK